MDRTEVRLRLIEKVYAYGNPQGAVGIVEIARILEAFVFEDASAKLQQRPVPRKADTP